MINEKNILFICRRNLIQLNDFFAEVDLKFLPRLPYCRRNLLVVSNFCMSKLFYNIISDAFIYPSSEISIPVYNFKEKYETIFTKYNYVNRKFLNLFLAFFSPLFLCINDKIKKTLDSSEPEHRKIKHIREYICNLYNLVAIQLFGLDVSCTILENTEICNNNPELCQEVCKLHGQPSCQETTSNSIILFVNPLFYEDQSILNDIVSSLKLIKDKQAILFVDYTYVLPENSEGIYHWEQSNSIERYNIVKQYVSGIYFVNFEKVSFGRYEDLVKSYLIYNKDEYNKVLNAWKEQKKAIKLR